MATAFSRALSCSYVAPCLQLHVVYAAACNSVEYLCKLAALLVSTSAQDMLSSDPKQAVHRTLWSSSPVIIGHMHSAALVRLDGPLTLYEDLTILAVHSPYEPRSKGRNLLHC